MMLGRLLVASAGLSLLASLVLAGVFFFYVPIGVDGTWYSYPAYAQSQGGDPSENIPGVPRQLPPPDRPVATFGWENRSNLTVLITSAWFRVVPPSWQSLKLFGVLQLVLLALLAGVCAWRMTAKPGLLLFAVCIVVSDARVIAESMADARPDMFIAVFATALLCLLIGALGSTRSGRSQVLIAAALALTLPLLHVTAAYALSAIAAFLFLFAFYTRHKANAPDRWRIALLIAVLFATSFLLKQFILDGLVPTAVPVSVELGFRHNLSQELQSILAGNYSAKLAMEMARWGNYFFFANIAHFLLLAVGAMGVIRIGIARNWDAGATMAMALAMGTVVAVVAMVLTDSHPMAQHLLAVMILAYLAACALLGALERSAVLSASRVMCICSAILLLATTLNVAHAYSLYGQYARFGLSNPAAEAALLKALPKYADVKVIGPTEVWPYLVKRRQPLLLVDDNRAVFLDNGGRFDIDAMRAYSGADFLVVNAEYLGANRWGEAIDAWMRQGLVTEVTRLGDCKRSVQCLGIYAFRTKVPATPPAD